jgi:hypothetical protein
METYFLWAWAGSEPMAEKKTTRHKIITPTNNFLFITTPPFLLEIDCKNNGLISSGFLSHPPSSMIPLFI